MSPRDLTADAVALLQRLIATPSISRQETDAADLLQQQMEQWGLSPRREANNLWAATPHHSDSRPTLLLNAHIDTVKPVASYTRDPFTPTVDDGRLYGLGANDCGGGLTTLLQVFRYVTSNRERDAACPYNLVYCASAEEEVSGRDGFERVRPLLPRIDVAIVGEPTGLQPAIAEKGLMVIDGTATGKSGHAARNEGINAIYEALDDLVFLRQCRLERESPLLGPVKISVTQVNAGTQHNVVPDVLKFVIDVRSNECYTNEEIFQYLSSHMSRCRLEARSFRLSSSAIDAAHPLVRRCVALGLKPFGSPTLSDQALMPFPSLKLGPGESARSHSADEYIGINEMQQAIDLYLRLLQ